MKIRSESFPPVTEIIIRMAAGLAGTGVIRFATRARIDINTRDWLVVF